MNIVTYDVLHVFGAMCLFLGLGGMAGLAMVDASEDAKKKAGKLLMALHGLGLLILLVAGFGALAKLNAGFPLWVMVKVVLWVFFGAAIALFKRMPGMARIWLIAMAAVGLLAAYLGNYKPF